MSAKLFAAFLLLEHFSSVLNLPQCTKWCKTTCTRHISKSYCCSYDLQPNLDALLVEACTKELFKANPKKACPNDLPPQFRNCQKEAEKFVPCDTREDCQPTKLCCVDFCAPYYKICKKVD